VIPEGRQRLSVHFLPASRLDFTILASQPKSHTRRDSPTPARHGTPAKHNNPTTHGVPGDNPTTHGVPGGTTLSQTSSIEASTTKGQTTSQTSLETGTTGGQTTSANAGTTASVGRDPYDATELEK
jgi:hypothetical protein